MKCKERDGDGEVVGGGGGKGGSGDWGGGGGGGAKVKARSNSGLLFTYLLGLVAGTVRIRAYTRCYWRTGYPCISCKFNELKHSTVKPV